MCLCEHNVDFTEGCWAQVIADSLENECISEREVIKGIMENNGAYTPEMISLFMRNNGKLPRGNCAYCYVVGGGRGNFGKVTPFVVNEMTKKDFEGKLPKIIRLGKRTEPGHFYYMPVLTDFLELCNEFGTRVILPTKMLQFNEKIATLLRETGSVVHYSIGGDCFEPGACSQGYTNQWRMERAQEYLSAGVNTHLTIVCDVTSSLERNVERGWAVEEAMTQKGIRKRLIPLRVYSKLSRNAKVMIGRTWQDAKMDAQMELDGRHSNRIRAPYLLQGSQLFPAYVHQDFERFVRERHICGRIGKLEYCDNCALMDPKEPFPYSQIIPVTMTRQRRPHSGKKNKSSPPVQLQLW